MPIRQNILRKGKAPKQNLLQFDVLQEESGVLGDLTTSRFFKISEFPSVLPSGNSSFLIEGSNLLKPEIELKTELLDADGNPIFHYAIPNYDKELPARRIAIEVYDDEVVNGVGSFTVLGELNPREFDIPSDFQDTYNVRFTAPISINRKIKNTQPIRFYGDPTISVSELVKGVIERVPTGDSTQTSITGSVEFINISPQTEFSTDSGSTTGNSNQFEEVGNSVASYVNQNQGSAQSSILPQTSIPKKPYTFVVKEMEKGVDNALNKITSGMKGASFSITRPDLLVDSTTYPDSKFDKPQTFDTKILDVINSTTFTTTTEYTITNKNNNNKIIVPLNASSSNATITHNVVSSTETEDQVFKRSFANMTVGNLRTFSGDTYKAKIYMKEEGTSGEFEPIYETLVESPNELVNPNSISGFQNIGLFFTQSIIENNWVSSSNSTATTDDDTLIDGVLLSGSNGAVGDSFTFVTNNTLSLEKNEDYIVEFNVAYDKASKTQSDGTTKKEAELEVFITGSFVTENQSEVSLGKVDLPGVERTNGFTKVTQRQITDFKTHNGNSSPSGSLGFRVNAGQFILQDVRLRPFSQTNFSPGFFKANVPMPKPIKRGKFYDFMVEFYDANNNLAETVAIVDNVSFEGPPQIIQGADNLLTGSMFLGSLTGSGIEVHGGSAYIRSIGYNGFDRTIGENVGGFMMFSGSVSESLGTSQSYDGVGLEIVDAHGDTDRFLKFRTNPSEFTVQTDQFFLGKDGQFISGSNGSIVISSSQFFLGGENTFVSGANDLLEISSSNFHLDNDGSVTMQGAITAEAGGTIGGFTIGSSSLSVGNVFQLSSSQDDEDPASFISSSKFKVSAGGQITGSDVLLSGGTITGATTITADVTILGSVSANSILVPATIAGAAANVGNASASIDDNGNAVFRSGSIGGFRMDDTTLFSDSAEFVVTGSTGQITGSQVLFTGGKIGGFDIDSISIASSNGNLIMSSSGQITASSADLTGDLNATHIKATSGSIGGFDLDSDFINSVDGNISINSADKAIRIANSTFGNTGVQLEYNSGTPRAHIGVGGGEGFKFDGSNVVMSSSAFLLGSRAGGNSFVSGSNGEIEISGSSFHLLGGTVTASNVDLSGRITAEAGEIGGFAITENAISSSNNELILRGAGTGTSAGQITGSRVLFSGGEIGGFLITSDTIETKDFASGLKGVRLSTSNNGSLEVEEARIRGTLKTTVFEKETVNAVGGQLIVANSTAITGSDVGKTDTTMSVENVTGFEADEILLIKKVSGSNFSTEYVQVISSSNDFNSDTNFQGKLMVSRSFGSSATYNPSLHSGSITTTTATGSTYTTGQVLVSTGKVNTGYIKLNANPNDSATPFIDIVERTGSGVFDVDLKARLGDLSGLSSGLVGSSPGFGLFSENVFLTGKITATSGEIAGWDIDSNILKSGTNIQLDSGNEKITISDQTFGNTGIQLEHNSGTPRAHIGKSNGEGFKFDGTNVVMSASSFQLGNNTTFVSGSNGNVKISGSSVDIQTPAFVFGDLNKAFISGSNGNLELSASNFILGTSASNAAGGNTGVGAYVSSSNNNLRISSSGFDLNSIGNVGTLNIANGKLTFDGSTLAIDGTVNIGSTAASTIESNANSALQSGDDISDLNNDSGFQNASDVNSADKTSGTVGGWTITSNELKSNSNKIILHQNNGKNGQIKVGSATSISAGDGIYMDGTGDFRVGDADGERIQFDESESELILSASAFKLGNQTSFVSGSNGNVKISGSSIDFQTPAFVLGDLNKGFISGSNGNLELSASNFILGTSGSGVGAYVSASNNNLRISSSAFDLDDDGTFNFANGKLTFNSGVLTIAGGVNIGSTAASTIESNANSALQSGDNVSDLNNDSGFQNASDVNTADKTDGTVGGWSITSNEIKSNSNKIILHQNNGVNGQIKLNAATSETAGDGVYMDGTGAFRAGDADGERIYFDGSNAIISASSFKMGNHANYVSGSNGVIEISSSVFKIGSGKESRNGALSTGAFISSSLSDGGLLTISSSNFHLSSSGNLNVGNGNMVVDTDGNVSVEGTITTNASSVLQAGDLAGFGLGSSDITLGGSGTTRHIKLDSSNKSISIADQTFGNTGIQLQYNSGTPRLHVGKSNGERITFDGTNAIVSASSFLMGNNTSFVSGSNGNVKISGSSVDIQTPAFVLGDLDNSFVSGSNGNLSLGATTFNLVATSSNAGIIMDSATSKIEVTGSSPIDTSGSAVILDGNTGIIQVTQSGDGIFDTGRTKAFTTTTFIEPQVFKPGNLRPIESSSFSTTSPTPTAANMDITSNLAVGGTLETNRLRVNNSSLSTPVVFLNEINRIDASTNTDGAVNPTASFAASQVTNYSDNTIDTNCHPAFVFTTDYFTELSTTTDSIGWVQNGSPPSGSNIFTIANTIRESGNHFADGKFNVLGLETNLSNMNTTDHQNEYTFLQAKHSGSIRLQIQHDGDVVSKGNLTAFGTSFLTVSDEREKKNIYTISESLDRILELRPTKFTWKETDKEDVGFIAQEVEEIIPEVIETSRGFINTDDSKERKTIAYPKLVPYLVDTIQQLTKRIEELEKKVK